MSNYEPVIGLETHVQLKTKSKLFCGCDNDARDKDPNTTVCPVCMGFPGVLPVLNEQAVKLAIRAGLALNGEIAKQSKFDRKNYFYPDLPHGYQITQYDQPIVGHGHVEVPIAGKLIRIGITRAHLEADAGKLTHPAGADYSLVDLNRAGTPLLEIVSEPDLRSPQEAKAYAQEVYNLVRYAGVSDADLYYGNMRFDVNISLRPVGSKEFGTRAEIKNLNSFRAVENAAEYEFKRQAELLDKGEKIVQETRGWDENKGKTFSQRSKEDAMDYRYFPEPDLPPLLITEAMKKAAGQDLILPSKIRRQLAAAGIELSKAEVLVSGDDLNAIDVLLEVQRVSPKDVPFAFNWLVGDRLKLSESKGQSLQESGIGAEKLCAVAGLVEQGQLSSTAAKTVLEELWGQDKNAEDLADKFKQVSDTGELEKIVEQVLRDNPGSVADYQAGKTQALGFLVGQVMKASRGQANPVVANDILRKQLEV